MQELVLELKNVEKSFLNKEIIKIEQLAVYQNERIGIIGKNGQGKSTLLNLISGAIQPDQGTIRKKVDFQYYQQIAEVDEQQYAYMDPALLGKLLVPEHASQYFSGGEETRFRLAQVFSGYEPGLLLDEPTTHLDGEGVRFLIEELQYYYGTLLVVSHDRHLLDEVAEKIWEVAEGTVTVYDGNYTDYLAQKEQERLTQTAAYEKFTKEKERLQKAVRQKQEQAEKLSKVSKKQKKRNVKPDRLSSSKQKDTVQKAAHKAAKSMEKRVEQLETVANIQAEKQIQFPVPGYLEMHNKFPIRGAEVTIQKGEKLLLDKVDFQFPLGKRIGIAGPNGSGKSSLLQHILAQGEGIILSPKVVFSTYQQMDYKLAKGKNLLDYLLHDSVYPEPVIRAILANLGFNGAEISKSVTDLSGGEATRLAFAKLFAVPSNVLVLDEPTNFIDIQTIESLEILMKNYSGTILCTSHDEYFMQQTAEQIWEIQDQKLILTKDNGEEE